MDAGVTQELTKSVIVGIAAGSAIVSAIVTSLIAPLIHEWIDKRKGSRAYKMKMISDTRELLDKSELMVDIRASSLWGFISDNLNEDEKKKVFPKGITIGIDYGGQGSLTQDDHMKEGVSTMLARLEKEWELLK